MVCRLDVKLHCSNRIRRSIKKASHDLANKPCMAAQIILARSPDYGVRVERFSALRKMRVGVPEARLGKRGGYRLIYRFEHLDEMIYIVLLDLYYKRDKEDLSFQTYQLLLEESDQIFADVLAFDWSNPPSVSALSK